jgi:hypothetical protein
MATTTWPSNLFISHVETQQRLRLESGTTCHSPLMPR